MRVGTSGARAEIAMSERARVALLSAAVAVAAIALWFALNNLAAGPPSNAPSFVKRTDADPPYSAAELLAFDGANDSPILVAILGRVFDVTAGRRFYGHGNSYAHFAGRDATAAFATGAHEGDGLTDDLAGLDDEQLGSVKGWFEFYRDHEEYTPAGRVVGRYFDAAGGVRDEFPWERLRLAEEAEARRKREFPGCNSKWTQAEGSEVWCTPKSGGVQRDWAGVPRLRSEAAGAGGAGRRRRAGGRRQAARALRVRAAAGRRSGAESVRRLRSGRLALPRAARGGEVGQRR